MSDDDLMRLMKDDRVLDMLDGLSDSESVREMSMSESDQEVREVKIRSCTSEDIDSAFPEDIVFYKAYAGFSCSC